MNDKAGKSVWSRIMSSPTAVFINLGPIVQLARPFLPFILGEGNNLPGNVEPEDVDYLLKNLDIRLLSTTALGLINRDGVRCDDSVWELVQ